MARIVKVASYGFAAAALGLFGWGLLDLRPSEAAPEGAELLLETAAPSFGEARSGQEVPVNVTLRNRASHPIQVVGASFVCTPQGCVKAKNLPLEIPPRDERDVSLLVDAAGSGDFQAGLVLYTDAHGQTEIPLEVTGRVLEDNAKQ